MCPFYIATDHIENKSILVQSEGGIALCESEDMGATPLRPKRRREEKRLPVTAERAIAL